MVNFNIFGPLILIKAEILKDITAITPPFIGLNNLNNWFMFFLLCDFLFTGIIHIIETKYKNKNIFD